MSLLTDDQVEALATEHLKYQIEGSATAGVHAFARAIEQAIALAESRDFRCEFAKQLYELTKSTGGFDSEEFGFAQEIAMQYGADYLDDDATVFRMSAEHIYVLMKAMGYQRKDAIARSGMLMPTAEPVTLILEELRRAVTKFPTWPTDPLHAVAVLGEEFGELTKAALQTTYEPHKSSVADVRIEAIQTAAMALRFVLSLDKYKYAAGEQHEQEGGAV